MILTLLGCFFATLIGLTATWLLRRWGGRRWPKTARVGAWLLVLAIFPLAGLAAYLAFRLLAGQPGPMELPWDDGVTYRREVLTTPNRAVVHVVAFDNAPGLRLVATPPVQTPNGPRNAAAVASDAGLGDIVINANFFMPFRESWFMDYAPHAGDLVEPIGPVVADGVVYGRPKADWPSFWQWPDGSIGMGDLPAGVRDAVTGRQWLLRDGQVAIRQDEPPYPRTAIATDADRKRLWFVVVDGKQPNYSDGLSLSDLAKYLASLGATDAIEMDGGGSSTLTYVWHDGPIVFNRPCHTKIPARQRPCGVFLGVRLPGRNPS